MFAARPGGAAERFADALGSRHPALVFIAALLGGFLLLLVASILLGLLIVHVLASGSGLGLAGEEQSFIEELVDERSGTLTTVSEVASQVGGAPVLPIIVGIIGMLLRLHPPLAPGGIRGLRPACRIGHLPLHLDRGPT